MQLSPEQFEHFGKEFLRSYGFIELEVTQVSGDGGIDGHGRLKVGVATMRVAFQCKRWKPKSLIGRPEVDKFRGAIQGEFEQGIFFTTSDYSAQAKDVSVKKGAVPVILINGEELVTIMIEKGIGVAKRPLFLFEEIQIPGVLEPDR